MDNRKVFAFSCLILALSAGYYFVVYLPQRDKEQLGAQQQQQENAIQAQKDQEVTKQQALQEQKDQNIHDLDRCLSIADNNYQLAWAFDCKKLNITGSPSDCTLGDAWCKDGGQTGLKGINTDCLLPADLATAHNSSRQESRDTCFKEYPQN